MMKKILKYLSILLPLIVAFGLAILIPLMLAVAYYSSYFYAGLISNYILGNSKISISDLFLNLPDITNKLVSIVTFGLPLIWAILFFFWYRHLTKNEKVTKIKVFKLKNIIIIALVALGYQLATTGLMAFIMPYFPQLTEQYTELMGDLFDLNPLLVFISVVILAPLSEEMIFRGVVMKKALGFTSFAVANIIQALCFAIFHGNLVQGVYTFFAGLAMGYIAYKFKTLVASIVFHMFFNVISYFVIEPTTTLNMAIYTLIGIIIAVVALRLVRKVGKGHVYVPEIDTLA